MTIQTFLLVDEGTGVIENLIEVDLGNAYLDPEFDNDFKPKLVVDFLQRPVKPTAYYRPYGKSLYELNGQSIGQVYDPNYTPPPPPVPEVE